MKTWRRLLALGVLVACAVPASAQPVTLRHKFVANQLHAYRFYVNGQGQAGVSGLPEQGTLAVPFQVVMLTNLRQRVLGIKPDGVATLRTVVDDLTVRANGSFEGQSGSIEMTMDQAGQRVKLDGKEVPQPPEAKAQWKKVNFFGKPFLTRMGPRGQVVSVELPERMATQFLPPGMDQASLAKQCQSLQILLPEKPVSVGEVWETTVSTALPGMPTPIKMEVKSQLVSVKPDETGRQIATIQQTATVNADNLIFTVPVPAMPGQAEARSMSLRFDRLREMISGPILWSVDEGQPVRMDLDVSMDIAMSMPTPMRNAQGQVQTQAMQVFGVFQAKLAMARK